LVLAGGQVTKRIASRFVLGGNDGSLVEPFSARSMFFQSANNLVEILG